MARADSGLENNGASSLLLYEAIMFSATRTETSDFDGCIIQPVDQFFRVFGSIRVPYSRMIRSTRRIESLSSKQLNQSIMGG